MLQIIEGVSCFWVDDADSMEKAVRALQVADVVAVDVEGDCLGHGGRAALIQLAIPEVCFVIDLAALGMPSSLRQLLQSDRPIKVGHGFTGDQINLIEQFDLDFAGAGIFDTQDAALIIDGPGHPSGVVDILASCTAAPDQLISEMKAMKIQLRFVDFFRRPLPKDVARYVCLDVVFLGSAFSAMAEQLAKAGVELSVVLEKSRYRGPYARGFLFQPPTEIQRERQLQKGTIWCEATRQWVSSGGGASGNNGACKGRGKRKFGGYSSKSNGKAEGKGNGAYA